MAKKKYQYYIVLSESNSFDTKSYKGALRAYSGCEEHATLFGIRGENSIIIYSK